MPAQHRLQSPVQPPAQPAYVLRGHTAQIHSICFLRDNTRLLTGDADGWVVLWSVISRRPVGVWRAHEGAILGVEAWGCEKVITHGRDGRLLVWQVSEGEAGGLSTVMPIEDAVVKRKEPWLLHSLVVNTLNFCSFAKCSASTQSVETGQEAAADAILVAVPGAHDGEVEGYELPSQTKVFVVPAPKKAQTGMVMAVRVLYHKGMLTVIAGYESGWTCLWQKAADRPEWTQAYVVKAHNQPVLSLDLAVSQGFYYTSGADEVVARHPLDPEAAHAAQSSKTMATKHAGQQSLCVRSDDRIFATAGWDGRIRVYSAKTMRELAVLKWHKEACYALAFALVDPLQAQETTLAAQGTSTELVPASFQTVEQKRKLTAQTTHWLAAGAKDGKVSLWDIY